MEENNKVIAPIRILDFRIIRPKFFLERNGNTVAAIQQLTQFDIQGNKISFHTPNVITMFVNKSLREYNSALKIYNVLIVPNLNPNKTYEVPEDQLSNLYDYFEHLQASIIAIYSAIEALGNVAIPNEYKLTKTGQRGITEIWNKANIERWTPTTEKIGNIVPEILQIKSPCLLPHWKGFLALKDIRDKIIHQKQSAQKPMELETGFFSTLLNPDTFTAILSGHNIIQYFCDQKPTHFYFPMLKDQVQCDVTIVDDFANVVGIEKSGDEM